MANSINYTTFITKFPNSNLEGWVKYNWIGYLNYEGVKYKKGEYPSPTPILPEAYQQVAWLQSTGTQYIDLGFKPNQTTKAKCKFNYQPKLASQPYTNVFGVRKLYKSKQFNTWDYSDDQASRGIRVDYNNGDNIYSDMMGGSAGILTTDQDYTFELGHAYFKCPELGITNNPFPDTSDYQDDFECEGNLYLFCINNNNTAQWFTSSKIKSFEAEYNGSAIRNLIPCYRKEDNVAGMYDLSKTNIFNPSTMWSSTFDDWELGQGGYYIFTVRVPNGHYFFRWTPPAQGKTGCYMGIQPDSTKKGSTELMKWLYHTSSSSNIKETIEFDVTGGEFYFTASRGCIDTVGTYEDFLNAINSAELSQDGLTFYTPASGTLIVGPDIN